MDGRWVPASSGSGWLAALGQAQGGACCWKVASRVQPLASKWLVEEGAPFCYCVAAMPVPCTLFCAALRLCLFNACLYNNSASAERTSRNALLCNATASVDQIGAPLPNNTFKRCNWTPALPAKNSMPPSLAQSPSCLPLQPPPWAYCLAAPAPPAVPSQRPHSQASLESKELRQMANACM